jgi:hypothetical protein
MMRRVSNFMFSALPRQVSALGFIAANVHAPLCARSRLLQIVTQCGLA